MNEFNEAKEAHYNVAVIKLLSLLDSMHPDSRGTILIHGARQDTESYAEIAKSADFKFERSETSKDFVRRRESNPHLLLFMIISDSISHAMRSSLMQICRNRDPIYVLHITTKEGDVPDSDQRYRSYIFHKNIVPEDAAVAQKMIATLNLLKRANQHLISRDPIPEYLHKSHPTSR